MTEETIKKVLLDNSKWIEYKGELLSSSKFKSVAKKLLEQHEAEMVEFMNWRDKNYPRVLEVSENLLFLFKNRNK